eukprot:scaffold269481_cov18-Tisochrysis_lutea.AAC.1
MEPDQPRSGFKCLQNTLPPAQRLVAYPLQEHCEPQGQGALGTFKANFSFLYGKQHKGFHAASQATGS